jgi:dihydrofolate reductase
MTELIADLSMSLDGFVAGPNPTQQEPLGVGGEQLHEWAFGAMSWREQHGLEGGEKNADSDWIDELRANIGAGIMGRKMYSGGSGGWDGDPNPRGWWGDDPPFHHPVFVLTHHPDDAPDDPSVTFVSEGFEPAVTTAREAAGDRAGALEAYGRGPRDISAPGWTREVQLAHARLLVQDKRWDAARPILQRLLKSSEGPAAAEAAYAIGETYTGEGDALAAVEYYLSAAYVAPDSAPGRRGLLSAARAFAAAKQPEMAMTAYKKLLAQSDLPADVRDAARKELAALPRPAP